MALRLPLPESTSGEPSEVAGPSDRLCEAFTNRYNGGIAQETAGTGSADPCGAPGASREADLLPHHTAGLTADRKALLAMRIRCCEMALAGFGGAERLRVLRERDE